VDVFGVIAVADAPVVRVLSWRLHEIVAWRAVFPVVDPDAVDGRQGPMTVVADGYAKQSPVDWSATKSHRSDLGHSGHRSLEIF
jgi:hypothetical protein